MPFAFGQIRVLHVFAPRMRVLIRRILARQRLMALPFRRVVVVAFVVPVAICHIVRLVRR